MKLKSTHFPRRKIPKTWEKGILIIWEKYGKKDIPKLQFSQKLWVQQKSIQFQKHGKSGFP